MRRLFVTSILICAGIFTNAQTTAADDVLLTKTRSLYDAPFTRGLISFDCAVQFDWKQHTIDVLKTFPPGAVALVERLQAVPHRVFVDRSGAVVSAIPKAPDLIGVAHATELEQSYQAIVTAGLNAWSPFSTNVILPVPPTQPIFHSVNSGYELSMHGAGVAATLTLTPELRVTHVVSQLPQPLEFTTEFIEGPTGFLLRSVAVNNDPGANKGPDNTFSYTYQSIDGFQLPSQVVVTPSQTPEVWRYSLTDCKTMKGTVVHVAPPLSINPKP